MSDLVERVAAALWEAPLPSLCGTAETLRRCNWTTVLQMAAEGELAEEENMLEFRAMARAIIPLIEADATARERERCARVADAFHRTDELGEYYRGHDVAAAIRAGDA